MVRERKRFNSNEDFWAKWSDGEGNHIRYQAILDDLKTERLAQERQDALSARAFFKDHPEHPEASTFFWYTKGGVKKPLGQDKAIAAKWRKLSKSWVDNSDAAASPEPESDGD